MNVPLSRYLNGLKEARAYLLAELRCDHPEFTQEQAEDVMQQAWLACVAAAKERHRSKSMNGSISRRNRIDLHTPEEQAIREAMQKVEEMGADIRLTEAVILLGKAQNKVADYVDGVEGASPPGPTLVTNIE